MRVGPKAWGQGGRVHAFSYTLTFAFAHVSYSCTDLHCLGLNLVQPLVLQSRLVVSEQHCAAAHGLHPAPRHSHSYSLSIRTFNALSFIIVIIIDCWLHASQGQAIRPVHIKASYHCKNASK